MQAYPHGASKNRSSFNCSRQTADTRAIRGRNRYDVLSPEPWSIRSTNKKGARKSSRRLLVLELTYSSNHTCLRVLGPDRPDCGNRRYRLQPGLVYEFSDGGINAVHVKAVLPAKNSL